jgi:hypothetical protein
MSALLTFQESIVSEVPDLRNFMSDPVIICATIKKQCLFMANIKDKTDGRRV